jgi:cytochrome c oxidase assembly protein subunit 15
MRLPTITPRTYAWVATAATISLALIVFTGAGVRLTGSGLGCTNWPTCDGSVIAPMTVHSWIEYGNRLISGVVGLLAIAAGLLAFRRRPYRKDLAILGTLLPIGVVMQAVLGMWTVQFHLQPGFVMGHFLLSMVILIAAVMLVWCAWHEPGSRPRNPDMLAVWGTRALFPISSLLFFMGTVATAAGPHPGSARTGEVVHRLDWRGSDTVEWAIHTHGRLGTALGVSCVILWLLLRRRGADRQLLNAIAATAILIGVQGVVGAIQYFNGLPAGIVWIHIVIATVAWMTMMWAVCAAGRAVPRAERAPASTPKPSARASAESA